MPLFHVYTQAAVSDSDRTSFLKELSSLGAELTEKPEARVMTRLSSEVPMTFGGSDELCAFVEVKSLGGFDADAAKNVSARVCELLEKRLNVPGSRVYLELSDHPRELWGHNGTTVG